jgi:hypothetical protein
MCLYTFPSRRDKTAAASRLNLALQGLEQTRIGQPCPSSNIGEKRFLDFSVFQVGLSVSGGASIVQYHDLFRRSRARQRLQIGIDICGRLVGQHSGRVGRHVVGRLTDKGHERLNRQRGLGKYWGGASVSAALADPAVALVAADCNIQTPAVSCVAGRRFLRPGRRTQGQTGRLAGRPI